MNQTLERQLHAVGQRVAAVRRGAVLTAGGGVLAVVCIIAIVVAARQNVGVSGGVVFGVLIAAGVVFGVAAWLGRVPRLPWVARRIEARYPDLDTRLITAVEQQPSADTGRLNVFQQLVVAEVLEHALTHRWQTIVSPTAFRLARIGQTLAIALLVLTLGVAAFKRPPRESAVAAVVPPGSTTPTVEPGDTSVERGTGLIVLARFAGQLPGDVKLLTKSAAGQVETTAMSRSLDDPVFAGRIANVQADVQYAVASGASQSPWYTAKVFDYPDLKQADAALRFPAYTKLADRTLEDVRTVTAVEGTSAKLTFKLNKPVTSAELLSGDGTTIPLSPDPAAPDIVSASVDLKQSQRLRLRLVDADKRENKQPAAEIALNVNPNRPPELKPVSPGRDVDVSPIQELTVGVRASDDFGVIRAGLTYGLAEQAPQDVVPANDIPGGQKRDVSHVISLEQMRAQPDQLVSYFFWAEDYAADGQVRRTQSDMYFAEVRPFEEIFRQGEQPSESEQQQRQQQQQQQGGGQGQQAEELAEQQKQIINATWKIIRRETAATLSPAFATDVELLRQSQASVKDRLAQVAERVTDAKSKAFVDAVQNHVDRAITLLSNAGTSKAIPPLREALAAEQSAYQALLKLRAREFEVTRSNQQQQQGQQSASSSSSRRQQQLDQLRMEQEQNRYETQRTAQQTPQENPQQRETRQVLNRLKELAQRQEDLNRQMQELKSALDQAQQPQQREEIERQLARLRDQQQQQLRDADELRDRMDRPDNQEQMADARQQMEQTRENLRRANEALQQNRVPEAAASGARAGEQLEKLRDQVRRDSAGQLADGMSELRDNARRLDQQQQQLAEQLKKLDETRQPGLRDGDDRKQLAQQLDQQKQQLNKLTEATRKMVEDAETTEPLASKQLYDTLRQSAQRQTEQALDASRQLLDRGLTNPARQAGEQAEKGVAELRKGIEQAATNVLGDETEALRRASRELDRLADELQRDVDRNRPDGGRTASAAGPTTRPGGNRTLAGGPATRPQDSAAANGNGPATRPGRRLVDRTPTTSPAGALASAAGNRRDDATASDRTGGPADAQTGPRGDRQTVSDQTDQPNAAGERQANSQAGRQAGDASQQPAGERGDGQRPGENGQPQQAGQAGQQPGRGESQGQQPGSARQPNGSEPANAGQPGQPQEGRGNGGRGDGQSPPDRPGDAAGQQPGTGEASQSEQTQQPGAQPGQGERGQGAQRGPGLRGGQGQSAGRGQPGERDANAAEDQPRDTAQNPGDANPRGQQPRTGRSATAAGGNRNAGDPNLRNDGAPNAGVPGDGDDWVDGPLTGENFRDWSDRLRDVEEMIGDPRLRDRAAAIRDRAREVRAELKRHSKQPNWDMVQQSIGTPLAELRDQVQQEVTRRQSPDALVPLDREAVPPQYAEQVKQYYERLGAGR